MVGTGLYFHVGEKSKSCNTTEIDILFLQNKGTFVQLEELDELEKNHSCMN